MHTKRNFERELVINQDGTVSHDECINHCLFMHLASVNIIILHVVLIVMNFDFLGTHVSSEQKINLDQIKEQLKYYLSYQPYEKKLFKFCTIFIHVYTKIVQLLQFFR
jgi:hypothetical protein